MKVLAKLTEAQLGVAHDLPFDDQAALTALENENACNPILRASARSIIEDTDQWVLSLQCMPVH